MGCYRGHYSWVHRGCLGGTWGACRGHVGAHRGHIGGHLGGTLPLATIDLVGDNREFEVFMTYFELLYSL